MDRPPDQSAAIPLWRNRDYMILLSGQTISYVGSFASQIAFPLLVLSITHSSLQAGLAGGLERVPFLLLTLPAGAMVDRWNRKLVMILCDTVRALAFAAIPLAGATGRLGMPLLYGVALVEGVAFAFFNLCQVSALPRVVPPEQLPTATARNQAGFGAAVFAGPPLAGLLFALQRTLPFLADAVSYAISTISLLFIKTSFEGDRSAPRRPILPEIREGISWLWQQPLIRFMAFLTGGINLLDASWALVLIVLAQRAFHASSGAIGLVLGVSAVGEIAGSFFGGWIQKRLSFGRAIATSCWGFAIGWTAIAAAPNLPVVVLLVAVAGFSLPTYDVVQVSYRLALIPDELQGRVNSVFRLIAAGTMPVGQVLVGALLQWSGPRATILCVGAGLGLLSLTATLNPQIRHAPPIEQAVAMS